MQIVICDDDRLFREKLEHFIYKNYEVLKPQIIGYSSGIKLLENVPETDLIFMDIEMPDMDGISVAKKLKEKNQNLLIVFLTNHEGYAMKGYEAKAFRYLLKPVEDKVLNQLFCDVTDEINKRKKIRLQTWDQDIFCPVQEIRYFEAKDKYSVIFLSRARYLSRNSIAQYEEQLSGYGFFRVHRKYLVNMYHVEKIDQSFVIIEGKEIAVSMRKRKPFREAFFCYMKGEILS